MNLSGRALTAPRASGSSVGFEYWRTKFVLLLVGAYIVFNIGFSLVRIPPIGPGVPIAELVIAVYALSLVRDSYLIGVFARSTPLVSLSAFWVLAVVHLTLEVPEYGFWAVRDAGHHIETSYIWIGFCAASTPNFAAVFERFFSRALSVATYLSLAYPFRDQLAEITPKISSVSGYTVSLFFSYLNASSAAMTGVFRILISEPSKRLTILIAGAVLFVLIALVQARVVYIQIAIVILLLSLFKPRRLSNLAVMAVVGVASAALVLALGVEVPGRLGQTFSWDFLVNHVAAIWGGGDDSVKAAADGVDLRLYWFQRVVEMVNRNPLTSLFGLGYGEPLTPFEGPDGDIVREPHNSFLSVYGRLGLVGFVLFLSIQIQIYWTCAVLVLRATRTNNVRYRIIGQTTLCFLLMNLVFSLVEGGFEVSYVAVPYYFMAGVIFSLNQQLRLMNRNQLPGLKRSSV
ncbi:O-antigen ligase family protein [Bradyrhizobium diazoefficiens]|nr:O-antigen ligase family protein [Bradyrhizobium diazoefficiens]MBR0703705.1 O-antigen ligase family protein [Bradyrhizobium diazoefficiens]MBR0772461.1 O-antigen ligase family protein [Bradyrhizobium diazoefficiens]